MVSPTGSIQALVKEKGASSAPACNAECCAMVHTADSKCSHLEWAVDETAFLECVRRFFTWSKQSFNF